MEMQDLTSETDKTQDHTCETDKTVEVFDPTTTEPQPSYVKLAMRNMVRKRGISLKHFFLTTVGLLGLLFGLSYLTR